ncbi:hypothetical protein EJB05_33697, partial [Eragrostis curvula]
MGLGADRWAPLPTGSPAAHQCIEARKWGKKNTVAPSAVAPAPPAAAAPAPPRRSCSAASPPLLELPQYGSRNSRPLRLLSRPYGSPSSRKNSWRGEGITQDGKRSTDEAATGLPMTGGRPHLGLILETAYGELNPTVTQLRKGSIGILSASRAPHSFKNSSRPRSARSWDFEKLRSTSSSTENLGLQEAVIQFSKVKVTGNAGRVQFLRSWECDKLYSVFLEVLHT